MNYDVGKIARLLQDNFFAGPLRRPVQAAIDDPGGAANLATPPNVLALLDGLAKVTASVGDDLSRAGDVDRPGLVADSMIAALFVERGGVYWDIPGVEPWDEERDARLYAGPHPVVAHPPCKRWGRYWGGGPSVVEKLHKGDDGGCFDRALWATRTFGGVLEHPEASAAWDWFGIASPLRGGWSRADRYGWTCCVEQGHYGHRARKATWLYAVGCDLPSLRWGPSDGIRMDDGFHTAAERAAAKSSGFSSGERLTKRERLATPVPFRDVLLGLARSVGRAA